jgi:hypothetical protein
MPIPKFNEVLALACEAIARLRLRLTDEDGLDVGEERYVAKSLAYWESIKAIAEAALAE